MIDPPGEAAINLTMVRGDAHSESNAIPETENKSSEMFEVSEISMTSTPSKSVPEKAPERAQIKVPTAAVGSNKRKSA